MVFISRLCGIWMRCFDGEGDDVMSRNRSDDSKHSVILLRETTERKKKLEEYAKLNRMVWRIIFAKLWKFVMR